MMYDAFLTRIAERMKSYRQTMPAPCTTEQIQALRARTKTEFDCELPDPYAEFLAKTNGLDWNGLVVLASERSLIAGYSDRFIQGFVEANLMHRDFEPMAQYLVFADDGVVLFTYSLVHGQYQVITRVGLTVLETADSFDQLLVNAFSGHV